MSGRGSAPITASCSVPHFVFVQPPPTTSGHFGRLVSVALQATSRAPTIASVMGMVDTPMVTGSKTHLNRQIVSRTRMQLYGRRFATRSINCETRASPTYASSMPAAGQALGAKGLPVVPIASVSRSRLLASISRAVSWKSRGTTRSTSTQSGQVTRRNSSS